MRLLLYFVIISTFSLGVHGQKSIEKTLKNFNKNTVEYITVEELKDADTPILLDTRKREEYDVSKIKDAVWVGYKAFEIDSVYEIIPDKDAPIVVYCSIGVRSENIGEKLEKAGYTNVKNLYGGIFEWKNEGNPVYDGQENSTEKVHAFSKHWGKLLTNGEKVYKP